MLLGYLLINDVLVSSGVSSFEMLVHGHHISCQWVILSFKCKIPMGIWVWGKRCHFALKDHAMSHQRASRDLAMMMGEKLGYLVWKTKLFSTHAHTHTLWHCSPPWPLLVSLINWLFLHWLNHQHSVPLPSPAHSNFPFGLNRSCGQHPKRRLPIPRNVCVPPTRACKTRKTSPHVQHVATTSCSIICAVIAMATSSNNKKRWSLRQRYIQSFPTAKHNAHTHHLQQHTSMHHL